MATIALPIEIKAREFHGKLWLASKLAEAGHRVALGAKGHLHKILFEEIKPDIYISKAMCKLDRLKNRFTKIQQAGGLVAVLDAEGGLASSQEDWFETRVWEELLQHVDAIFAWGNMQAEAISQLTSFPSESVSVTGNPRFDLLHPSLRKLYAERAADIQQRFGRYVLFNMNFGTANPFDEANRNQLLDKMGVSTGGQEFEYRSKIFEEFLSAITNLSREINREIVVRPHPGENHETYHSKFADVTGVHVEFSGDVRPWILGSDAVVHNNCTTGIESSLLNKQVIAFEPDVEPQQPDKFSLPNYVSISAETVDDLIQYTDVIPTDTKYSLSDDQRSKLRQKLENVTELSAPKIVDSINDLAQKNNATAYPSLSLERKIKSAIKKQPVAPYIQRLRGQTNGRSGKKKQKIPELSLQEIRSNLARLNVDTDRIKSSRVTYIDSVFWINKV